VTAAQGLVPPQECKSLEHRRDTPAGCVAMLKNTARGADREEGRSTHFLEDRPFVDADAI
jgi:hypothetical protein